MIRIKELGLEAETISTNTIDTCTLEVLVKYSGTKMSSIGERNQEVEVECKDRTIYGYITESSLMSSGALRLLIKTRATASIGGKYVVPVSSHQLPKTLPALSIASWSSDIGIEIKEHEVRDFINGNFLNEKAPIEVSVFDGNRIKYDGVLVSMTTEDKCTVRVLLNRVTFV